MSAATSDTHKCPVQGCERQVPAHHLMCGRHWRCVPEGLAQAVYRTYRQMPHSAAHFAAMRAAVDSVNSLAGLQPQTQEAK